MISMSWIPQATMEWKAARPRHRRMNVGLACHTGIAHRAFGSRGKGKSELNAHEGLGAIRVLASLKTAITADHGQSIEFREVVGRALQGGAVRAAGKGEQAHDILAEDGVVGIADVQARDVGHDQGPRERVEDLVIDAAARGSRPSRGG